MSRGMPNAIADVSTPAAAARGLFADLIVLTKARLTTMVMITTFVGSCMASRGRIDWLLLFHTLLGTALVAASSQVLNQVIEAEVDQFMERTRNRPLPAGRMSRTGAALFGFLLGVTGVFYLAALVNPLAAYLSASTIVIYLLLYTPLKRRTPLCISVGAVAGAIPPVIGYAAVQGSLEPCAWILFGILFFWQMPHFLAIAWMYHREYEQAGFVMLRPKDRDGWFAALEAFLYAIALFVVSVLPARLGLVADWYVFIALACNAPMLLLAARFLRQRDLITARQLFLASLLFLPALLTFMVMAKA